jgi:metal-responsive CopG/Arc/MetJ family transcriptional regulator
MDDVKRSEWIRDAVIEKLLRLKRQHEYLSQAFGSATYSLNTSGTQNKSPTAGTVEPNVLLTNEVKEQ